MNGWRSSGVQSVAVECGLDGNSVSEMIAVSAAAAADLGCSQHSRQAILDDFRGGIQSRQQQRNESGIDSGGG